MRVKIFRSGRNGEASRFDTFEVPAPCEAFTVMDVLNYISEKLDPTLAYYAHSACNRGICGRWLLRVNGKPGLACETRVDPNAELLLEPAAGRAVVKDLVTLA